MKAKKIGPHLLDGSTSKKVRKDKDIPSNFDAFTPAWKFHMMDFAGSWGWNQITAEDILTILTTKVKDKEHLNWAELQRSGSHNVERNQLIKSAQERLIEIGQDDLDQLFSLRLSGKERIWGIRDRYALKILWWDPNHQVCPSYKKHT
jgi:hypothetical protein